MLEKRCGLPLQRFRADPLCPRGTSCLEEWYSPRRPSGECARSSHASPSSSPKCPANPSIPDRGAHPPALPVLGTCCHRCQATGRHFLPCTGRRLDECGSIYWYIRERLFLTPGSATRL